MHTQPAHEYRIGATIQCAYERYGKNWFEKVTIVYEPGRGYLLNIAHAPRV